MSTSSSLQHRDWKVNLNWTPWDKSLKELHKWLVISKKKSDIVNDQVSLELSPQPPSFHGSSDFPKVSQLPTIQSSESFPRF